MFVIESCQKIKYNALFMMIFIPDSNFGDQPLGLLYYSSLIFQVHTHHVTKFLYFRWFNVYSSKCNQTTYLGSRGHFPTFWGANLLFSNLSRYLIGYIVNWMGFNYLLFIPKGRDIHIECSKQFKWNLYF